MIWLPITKSVYPSQLDTPSQMKELIVYVGRACFFLPAFPTTAMPKKQQHLLLDQVEKKSPKTKNKKREMRCLLL